MPRAEEGEVFAAAESVLAGLGYEIDRRDEARGFLISRPVEGASEVEPPGSGPRISSRARTRRLVEIRVRETPEAIGVFCEVAIQEQTTPAHRMFAATRAGDDRPSDTAIDREAATTTEQNTVWQTVRRDKSAERAILDAIVARAGGAEPSEVKAD